MSKTLLDIYIETLVNRVNIKSNNTIPTSLDVVFDGGAFNGGMGIGVAIYLKQLERLNRISVHRVSGCSIGSIVALYYLVDINYKDINKMFLEIRNCFQENFNLTRYKDCVRRFIYSNMSDDLSTINNQSNIMAVNQESYAINDTTSYPVSMLYMDDINYPNNIYKYNTYTSAFEDTIIVNGNIRSISFY